MDDPTSLLNLGTNVAIVLLFLRYMTQRDHQIMKVINHSTRTSADLHHTVNELNHTLTTHLENQRSKTQTHQHERDQ